MFNILNNISDSCYFFNREGKQHNTSSSTVNLWDFIKNNYSNCHRDWFLGIFTILFCLISKYLFVNENHDWHSDYDWSLKPSPFEQINLLTNSSLWLLLLLWKIIMLAAFNYFIILNLNVYFFVMNYVKFSISNSLYYKNKKNRV